jgi:hypothetical protein
MSVFTVAFRGGEPLARPEILALAADARAGPAFFPRCAAITRRYRLRTHVNCAMMPFLFLP